MYSTIQTALETYFQENWPHTPIDWENSPLNSNELKEYASFSIQFGDSQIVSLGQRCYRTVGVIFVQVFVRPSGGAARLLELATNAANLFKVPAIGDSKIVSGPSLTKRPGDAGGWVQATVATDFYFDEVI